MQISLIEKKIYEIRGQKVIMDFDLAALYEVETRVLKQAVNRNIHRFPSDFMFEITRDEYNFLRSQIVTLEKSQGRGKYSKYLSYAFTEQGVAMLSSVLNSEKAIEANIAIIRTFVMVRKYALNFGELSKKIKQLEKKYNQNFNEVIKALDFLVAKKQSEEDIKNRIKIGFKPG